MNLTESWELPTDPETAYAAATNVEFQEAKAAAAGALSATASVAPNDRGGDTVVLERTSPTSGVPEILKKFVGQTTDTVDTVVWSAPAADGSRTADVTIDVKGAPMTGTGTARISPGGAGTRVDISVDLKAKVPLIGGKVEQAAAPEFRSAIVAERDLGLEWLAQGRL